MAGEIVHIELPSGDFTRSAAFYGKVFGWTTDGIQAGGHLLFDLPGGVQGSWIRDALAQAPGPVPFVAVTDVDKTLAEVERQGGRVLVRRLPLASRGTFGLFADQDGNVVGVLATKASPAVTGKADSKTDRKTDTKAEPKDPKMDLRAEAKPKSTDKAAPKKAASKKR